MGWCIYWDPCGLSCYLFGWFTILYVNYTVTTEVVWPWLGGHWSGLVHIVGFQFLIALICASYIKAATTDPGSVERETATVEDQYAPKSDPLYPFLPKRRFCSKCNCIKPPRAHHCSTCGRCINKMDHHCPWVNNCVGSNNLKFFLLFLLYVFLGGIYTTLMFAARFVYCWRNSGACEEPTLYTVIASVLSGVLGIFFAIFTAAMAWDQWEGIVTNTTGIESMKGWDEQATPLMAGLTEVFGEPFSWRWFSPVDIHETGPVTGFYCWSPNEDWDAYDVRDPNISKHFGRIERDLATRAKDISKEAAAAEHDHAVRAAAEIHRLHAIKVKPPPKRPAPAATAAASTTAGEAAPSEGGGSEGSSGADDAAHSKKDGGDAHAKANKQQGKGQRPVSRSPGRNPAGGKAKAVAAGGSGAGVNKRR